VVEGEEESGGAERQLGQRTPGSLQEAGNNNMFLLNYLIESYKYIYSLLLIIYKSPPK
jgi:hypothetical protein